MLKVELKPHRQSLLAGAANEQKLFAMLKLLPEADVAQAKPPLALALVVDTSMSMYEFTGQNLDRASKIEIAIDAAHKLVDDPRLEQGDQVAVVHFDDQAKTLQPLVSIWDRQSLHRAITELGKHSGTTNMAAGLEKALVEMAKVDGSIAKRLFLLTDGATIGEDQCHITARKLAAINAPVIALGLGDTYNDELLASLADITQGRPYHLHDITDLDTILEDEVGSSIQEVVTNLKGGVSTVKGVRLDSLTRVYPNLAKSELSDNAFHMGNVEAGDYTVYIAEFSLAATERTPSRVRIAQFSLAGHAPAQKRYMELEPIDLFVEFTEDEVAASQIDQEVMGYVQQKNVDHLVSQATRLVGSDPDRAKTILLSAVGLTQRLDNPEMTRILEDAVEELDESGSISAATSKTMVLSGKTQTIKTSMAQSEQKLSDDEIRKLTGV